MSIPVGELQDLPEELRNLSSEIEVNSVETASPTVGAAFELYKKQIEEDHNLNFLKENSQKPSKAYIEHDCKMQCNIMDQMVKCYLEKQNYSAAAKLINRALSISQEKTKDPNITKKLGNSWKLLGNDEKIKECFGKTKISETTNLSLRL